MAAMFCQNCGEPLLNDLLPHKATASKVRDPRNPNKTIGGLLNLHFRCYGGCRKSLILAQMPYKEFEDAVRYAAEMQTKIDSSTLPVPDMEPVKPSKFLLLHSSAGDYVSAVFNGEIAAGDHSLGFTDALDFLGIAYEVLTQPPSDDHDDTYFAWVDSFVTEKVAE